MYGRVTKNFQSLKPNAQAQAAVPNGRNFQVTLTKSALFHNQESPLMHYLLAILGQQHKLATLRTDASLFKTVETLRWRGPTPAFAAWTERMEAPRLLERCEKAAS
jgi:hypothetical protein